MDQSGNPFVWYDLITADTESAAAFYGKVVGWSASDSGMPGVQYTIFSADGAMVAGLMRQPQGDGADAPPPMWNGHIYVDDVDASVSRAVSLGGSMIREPSDIPEIGRWAVVADPTGASFTLFRPTGTRPESEGPTGALLGHVGWHELHSGDAELAWPYYRKLFGWVDTGSMDMGEIGRYQMFSAAGEPAGGMMTVGDGSPSGWLFYFNVDGIDAAAARVNKGGGQTLHAPHEVPGGQWIVPCRDPQGAYFALVSRGR